MAILSEAFEKFFWGGRVGNRHHYSHYSRIATGMRIAALLEVKKMKAVDEQILKGTGFSKSEAHDIWGAYEKSIKQDTRLGEQEGHVVDYDLYVNNTPYIERPIVGLFEVFENLGDGLAEGEFPTFNWKFKNDFPNGVSCMHGTKLYILDHSTHELAMMWLAFKRTLGIFAELKEDCATPTFNYTETISPSANRAMTAMAEVWQKMCEPEPTPPRHKRKEDPTRMACLNKRVTKSRNAAKAAKKARKK